MATVRTIVSLIQFVALALPAVAILMQVTLQLEDSRKSSSAASGLKMLTVSMYLLIFGGLFISIKFLSITSSDLIRVGVLSILASFILLALGITRPLLPADFTIPKPPIPSLVDEVAERLYSNNLTEGVGAWLIFQILHLFVAIIPATLITFHLIIMDKIIGASIFAGDLSPLAILLVTTLVIWIQTYGALTTVERD